MSNERTRHKEILNRYGIKLDPLAIHNKDFAVRFRGYDQEEVDDFLDEIIRDYERMVEVIEELVKQAEHAMAMTREVKRPVRTSEASASKPAETEAKERTVSRDEIAMIKVRLANLERKVFGSSRSE
jgi:DivIVA domain-containing protein